MASSICRKFRWKSLHLNLTTHYRLKTNAWIWMGNNVNFAIAAGLIEQPMPDSSKLDDDLVSPYPPCQSLAPFKRDSTGRCYQKQHRAFQLGDCKKNCTLTQDKIIIWEIVAQNVTTVPRPWYVTRKIAVVNVSSSDRNSQNYEHGRNSDGIWNQAMVFVPDNDIIFCHIQPGDKPTKIETQ